MAKFKIEILRRETKYSSHTVELETNDIDQAREMALEYAGEHEEDIEWESRLKSYWNQNDISVGNTQEVN